MTDRAGCWSTIGFPSICPSSPGTHVRWNKPFAVWRVTVVWIKLSWKPLNAGAHDELVALTRRLLRKVGAWYVLPISLGVVNTTHQCGTAVFGTDPRTSVLDTWCRAHDVDNLFVVDASFFPSSASVNPALTIAAQALRSADHIKETHLT